MVLFVISEKDTSLFWVIANVFKWIFLVDSIFHTTVRNIELLLFIVAQTMNSVAYNSFYATCIKVLLPFCKRSWQKILMFTIKAIIV